MSYNMMVTPIGEIVHLNEIPLVRTQQEIQRRFTIKIDHEEIKTGEFKDYAENYMDYL